MADKKTNNKLGTGSEENSGVDTNALLDILSQPTKTEALFLRNRQVPIEGENGETIIIASPVGSKEEVQAIKLAFPNTPEGQQVFKAYQKFGGLPSLKVVYAKDPKTNSLVIRGIITPDETDTTISIDGPKGQHSVDISGLVGKACTLLDYNCEHALLERFSSIVEADSEATRGLLEAAKVEETLKEKENDPNSFLTELLDHHRISAEELAAFYKERTEGKTLKEILGAELSEPLSIGEQPVHKLGINVGGGALHSEVRQAAFASATLTKEIALKFVVARRTMDYLIEAGQERTVDGELVPSDAEIAYNSYILDTEEGPFPSGQGIFAMPNAYGSGTTATPLDAMPVFKAKGGKTKFNIATEEYGQQLYSLMNSFQLDLGNQFIAPNTYPAKVLDKSLLFTTEKAPNEEGRKDLQAENLIDPLQLEMIDRALLRTGKDDFATVLEERHEEVGEIISTDPNVIAERDANNQFSAAGAAQKAAVGALRKADLDAPEDNSKAIMGIMAIAFGTGLSCLEKSLDGIETISFF